MCFTNHMVSRKHSFIRFCFQIQRYFILTICSKSNKCLPDIRVLNSNQGSTFKYTLSDTSKLPATFSATLRAGTSDRLSQAVIFNREAISEVMAKADSGKNYASISLVMYIFNKLVLDKNIVSNLL